MLGPILFGVQINKIGDKIGSRCMYFVGEDTSI